MKPSKKPYTTPPKKRAVVRGSIEHKLMQLHNRIENNDMTSEQYVPFSKDDDKQWVWTLVEDIQNKRFTKLCKEDFEKCNGLWRQYETR